MTNTEYETASVQAAMGHRKLAAVDKQIEQVESTLVFLLHSRREIVNQYDLNKKKPCCTPTAAEIELLSSGDFCAEELWGGHRPTCPKCIGGKL